MSAGAAPAALPREGWLSVAGPAGPAALRVRVLGTFLGRFRGLLGREGLPPDEGVLLVPCASIHTAFMRFPIDAAFLDAAGQVLRVAAALAPFRAAACPGAAAVLEVAAGTLDLLGVAVGDRLVLRPAAP